MSPSHIASLHSGRMIVASPGTAHPSLTAARMSMTGTMLEVAAGAVFGGEIYGLALANQTGLRMSKIRKIDTVLSPYAATLVNLYPRHEFMDISRSAADHVHWMGKNPVVRMYAKPGEAGSAEKSHIAHASSAQATVFVDYTFGFGLNLKSLAVKAHVQVYSRGAHRGDLIDGTDLDASVQLMKLAPPLKAHGFEAMAASKLNDWAALGARANVWFENGGARYKSAVARDMAKLRFELTNYLNGRQGRK